jgi:hypothetical protein
MSKKANGRGALRIYKSYNFVDKDPSIDFVHSLMDRHNKTARQIQEAGGPTSATIYNWINGKTRRPQFCTVAAATLACGVSVIDLRKLLNRS